MAGIDANLKQRQERIADFLVQQRQHGRRPRQECVRRHHLPALPELLASGRVVRHHRHQPWRVQLRPPPCATTPNVQK